MRVAGIMSGTSLDGIDVAVVDIEGRQVNTVAFECTPYSHAVRKAILAVSNAVTTTAAISRLNVQLGELYAAAVLRLPVPLASIELIGCHGQTIYHESGRNTMQIGEAAVIAERTGKPVVSDFRPRDIAAGGKGAPLAPFVDCRLFPKSAVALNIGGIANITAVAEGIAFDTGPGNMVSDQLVERFTRGRLRFDRDGRIAARGRVNQLVLDGLLCDPYYRRKPPKSAGREQYGAEFIERLIRTKLPLPDLIATAAVFTAATIAEGIRRFAPGAREVIASGGGVHNPTIMAYLAAFLPGLRIDTTASYGIDPDAKEAVAFAILAYQTWKRKSSNLPSATGARHPAILGKISYGD